jgi:hypothetical protein
MRPVPEISSKGRRVIVALCMLVAGAISVAITLDPNFRDSPYWKYVHGQPLLYLIYISMGALLAKLGFNKEVEETDEVASTILMWIALIGWTLLFGFITFLFAFAGGAAVYYLASTSLAAAIWTSTIVVSFIWLIYITATKDR